MSCSKRNGNMIVGYARVSTDGQTLDHQQATLAAAGAEKVFAEKVSGAVTDREALAKAILALGPGDVLLVTRLDGWRVALVISSTSSTPLGRLAQGSGPSLMRGPIPPRHTVG
jgi:DNA invertase Pin-like site-specific DNA recombinase